MNKERTGGPRGPFISFEGGEGTGKSTQSVELARRLAEAGVTVITTREPGGAPGAEDIRSLLVNGDPDRWTPLSEALLNFAARQNHLTHTIIPALTTGQWVLCDRFVDSTMAYQGMAGGLDEDIIDTLTAMVVGPWIPRLTFIFDLDPKIGLERARLRGDKENRFERKGLAYHETLRQGFLCVAEKHADRCIVIDASASVEMIADQIWHHVQNHFSAELAGLTT